MNNFFNTKEQKGFTIVETLVAVAILMISIAGPLTIAQKSLMSAIQAKDQVTASFLAQDAMEYIKNIRDTNKANGRSWLDEGLEAPCAEGGDTICTVDTISDTINSSTIGQDNYLYYSPTGYVHVDNTTATEKSIFQRYLVIIPSDNPREATVIVTVKWKNGTLENEIRLENQIFDIEL